MKRATSTSPELRSDDVQRMCGDILDWKVSAIVATGGTVNDLEEALARLSGLDEVEPGQERELSGKASQIADILEADVEPDDDR